MSGWVEGLEGAGEGGVGGLDVGGLGEASVEEREAGERRDARADDGHDRGARTLAGGGEATGDPGRAVGRGAKLEGREMGDAKPRRELLARASLVPS